MRQHTVELLPIAPFLSEGRGPEKVLRKLERMVWQVRVRPVNFQTTSVPEDWALVRDPSELVRIPLIPYRTQSKNPAELLISAMDMAARCFMDFPNAMRVHIIMGDPVEDLSPEAEAFRYWVGIALQLH